MKIAVLTSGGDAPGMNAGVRAVSEQEHVWTRSLWHQRWIQRTCGR